MAHHPHIPAGANGVRVKQQNLQKALTDPLTPVELWKIVQSQRGFASTPGGADDGYRNIPATLPKGFDKGPGTPVGKGFETFAGVQVVDKEGRRVSVGAGYFASGGPANHAEARAVRGLEHDVSTPVPKGRLIVVVEKDPCPDCERALLNFSKKRGIAEIEVHMPERASMNNPSINVTPKTAARTSFQARRPDLKIRRTRTIKVPVGEEVLEVAESPRFSARTALVGTMANIAAGLALGILQETFKDKIAKDLENLPKPKIDKRGAEEYFKDPKLGGALRTIDLLNKNLGQFTNDVRDRNIVIINEVNLEIAAIALSSLSDISRIEFVTGMQQQLNEFHNELLVIRSNIEAARRNEAKALDAAKGAEDLCRAFDRGVVVDWLFNQGFSVEEIARMYENLLSFASRVRSAFQDLATLQAQIDSCISDQETLAHEVAKIYWNIILTNAAKSLPKQ